MTPLSDHRLPVDTHEARLQLDIEKAEQLAYQCQLYATAQLLNQAKNKCGWERADRLEKAKL